MNHSNRASRAPISALARISRTVAVSGLLTASLVLLAGCQQGVGAVSAAEPIDQDNLCQVSEWKLDTTSKACKPGQKVAFLPSRWSSEQLPIYFAAANCDMRYAVAQTNGGVVCIFKPVTPTVAESQ